MERMLEKDLLKWKDSEYRKPLILQGVRQCGKTHILRDFGKRNYANVAYFNFEGNATLQSIFEDDLDPKRIVSELSDRFGKPIDTDTLIIFDEIQFCGPALTSLKYFYEECPEYHVVCAGSLLGVMLSKPLSFPVGKVDFLDLRPMSFFEFLLANDEKKLCDRLKALDAGTKIPSAFTGLLKKYLSEYIFTGGMPEAVLMWIRTRDPEQVRMIQSNILRSYDSDFAKHAPKKDIPRLNAIWSSIPTQLARENSRFFFGHAIEGGRARDMEDALQWLIDAGLVYKVRVINRPAIPLSAYSTGVFKVYYSDTGLLGAMAGIPSDSILSGDERYREFKGAMAENFVLTELMSISGGEVFTWRSGNTAEVDFIRVVKDEIVPIEVKSEKFSRARSLTEYISKYDPKISFIISKDNVKKGKITILPLCLIWKMEEYV